MDYEGTKRNVGPPGHPYGAACVAILERDGGMSSMCRGRASIFPDDYLGIRENRVTHTVSSARIARYFYGDTQGAATLFPRVVRPFPYPHVCPSASSRGSQPPCASDGSSRSAASPLLCRCGGRGGRAPTHDFDGKKLTIKNMTIWKN